MKGQDAGSQRHSKKGQGQEFLHVFLLSKIASHFSFGPGDSKSEQDYPVLPRHAFAISENGLRRRDRDWLAEVAAPAK